MFQDRSLAEIVTNKNTQNTQKKTVLVRFSNFKQTAFHVSMKPEMFLLPSLIRVKDFQTTLFLLYIYLFELLNECVVNFSNR